MKSALNSFALVLCIVTLGAISVARADTDASWDDVYTALRAGHVAQAQQMIDQVLRDHPNSAKAHYVAAEVDLRSGRNAQARQELQTAQSIEPGLPFASARAVQELQSELSPRSVITPVPMMARPRSSFPWGWVFLIGGVLLLWGALRRRFAPAPGYTAPYNHGPFPNVAPGAYPPGPYPYQPGGSGLMGSIGSGLAMGAGIVAGEELVHRVFDGDRGGSVISPADAGERVSGPENADMGGRDFGINDPSGSWDDNNAGGGSSWDDNSGGGFGDGGGGGDSWT